MRVKPASVTRSGARSARAPTVLRVMVEAPTASEARPPARIAAAARVPRTRALLGAPTLGGRCADSLAWCDAGAGRPRVGAAPADAGSRLGAPRLEGGRPGAVAARAAVGGTSTRTLRGRSGRAPCWPTVRWPPSPPRRDRSSHDRGHLGRPRLRRRRRSRRGPNASWLRARTACGHSSGPARHRCDHDDLASAARRSRCARLYSIRVTLSALDRLEVRGATPPVCTCSSPVTVSISPMPTCGCSRLAAPIHSSRRARCRAADGHLGFVYTRPQPRSVNSVTTRGSEPRSATTICCSSRSIPSAQRGARAALGDVGIISSRARR